jgi:V/A-type H+-transporting ATPase subunit I
LDLSGNSSERTGEAEVEAAGTGVGDVQQGRKPGRTFGSPHGGERVSVLLISMKRDRQEIARILNRYDWQAVELSQDDLGSKDEIVDNLNRRIASLRGKQRSLGSEVVRLIGGKKQDLDEMWRNLRLNELFYRIQSYFSRTARTMIFSGWLPSSKRKSLDEGIRRVSGDRCYLEWHEPEVTSEERAKEIPVILTAPRLLAPFKMLVTNYSIPEYGTVDPTPFVAIAYLVMFGLMFGDAGHGAVLALLGIIGSVLFRNRSEGTRRLASLMIWCGASSIISGVLFGSYFGMRWLNPLWFDYHGVVSGHTVARGPVHDIYGILMIAIYFGIGVIALGLLLNWINLISKREWKNLIFEKGGVLGGWIYAAGIYTAYYFVRHDYRELPGGNLLFVMLGLPAIFLLLKPPLDFLSEKKRSPEERLTLFSFLDFLMRWIVEMLEIFSGYLANTLSFMRVAGLGIAHVSLMMAFFEIARMAGSSNGYSIWSILILAVGNLLVIALEGLSAGIQSLRLNYYEFFSKYFRGSGKAYMPVSLRSQE